MYYGVPGFEYQAFWKVAVNRLLKESPSRFFRLVHSRVIDIDDCEVIVGVIGPRALAALRAPRVQREVDAAAAETFSGRRVRFVLDSPIESRDGVH